MSNKTSDEGTLIKILHESVKDLKRSVEGNCNNITKIVSDVSYIKQEMRRINKNLEEDYVRMDEYEPVRKLVFGATGIILVAVLTAVVGLVVIQVK